jgi:DNA-directed RNA polymerase specialized sigma24 family protein
VAWIERDHPFAELVCTVAADGSALVAPGTVAPVLSAAWRAALDEVGAGTGEGGLRTVLLREVLYALDDAGRLDTATPDVPVPGPYLPAGDPWEGWWADDDAVPPLTARLRRDQVVAALRQLPLGLRVLLVLRDGAGLPAGDATDLVAGSADQQDALLGTARVGFICLIDEHIGEEDRA